MNIFGTHDIPVEFKHSDFSLSIEEHGDHYLYKRETKVDKVEKLILSKKKPIVIHPIEPVTQPKIITPYLLIELSQAVILEEKISKVIYLKFPIEIGIFLSKKKNQQTIDILTLVDPSFYLYGDPRNGVICRYFKSDVYSTIPPVDILREGVLELKLSNKCSEWTDVHKMVFDSYGMNIYFNRQMAFMKAEMEIHSQTTAETENFDMPYSKEMEKSIQLFYAKKIPTRSNGFAMREGY